MSNLRVLIIGERASGKTVLAQRIAAMMEREGNIVVVNDDGRKQRSDFREQQFKYLANVKIFTRGAK